MLSWSRSLTAEPPNRLFWEARVFGEGVPGREEPSGVKGPRMSPRGGEYIGVLRNYAIYNT